MWMNRWSTCASPIPVLIDTRLIRQLVGKTSYVMPSKLERDLISTWMSIRSLGTARSWSDPKAEQINCFFTGRVTQHWPKKSDIQIFDPYKKKPIQEIQQFYSSCPILFAFAATPSQYPAIPPSQTEMEQRKEEVTRRPLYGMNYHTLYWWAVLTYDSLWPSKGYPLHLRTKGGRRPRAPATWFPCIGYNHGIETWIESRKRRWFEIMYIVRSIVPYCGGPAEPCPVGFTWLQFETANTRGKTSVRKWIWEACWGYVSCGNNLGYVLMISRSQWKFVRLRLLRFWRQRGGRGS